MFEQAMKALKDLEAAINRVGEALEKLKVIDAPAPKAEIPTEKKPVTPRAKKSPDPVSAVTPSPATAPIVAPSAAPVPVTVPVPVTPPPVVDTTEEEEDDLAPAYTADDVRNAAIKFAAAEGEEAAKEIIKTIGNSPNIKGMKPEHYTAVMQAFKGV